MKPSAVRYHPTLTFALPELARGSSRYGKAAYLLSLLIAGVTFAGAVFYKEISRTFGTHVFGMRASTLWEGAFAIAALAWLIAMGLGFWCLSQKGRQRTFGVASIGMNLAAALLVACTLA